jgi:hypothetical protein
MFKFIVLFFVGFLTVNIALAQKDEAIKQMPVINGHLIYTDSISVQGHTAAQLDTAAKKWFYSYFKYTDTNIVRTAKDKKSIVFNRGVFEFKCTPMLITMQYYGIVTMQVQCKNNYYTYKIYHVWFRPKNGVLNELSYKSSADYLLTLYNKKHLSFSELLSIDKAEVKSYLFSIDTSIRLCISSLNKAMAN